MSITERTVDPEARVSQTVSVWPRLPDAMALARSATLGLGPCVIAANDAFAQLLGVPLSDIEQTPVGRIFGVAFETDLMAHLGREATCSGAFIAQANLELPSSSRKTVEIHCWSCENGASAAGAIILVARDAMERHWMVHRMRGLESQLAMVLGAPEVGSWLMDARTRTVLRCSRQLLRLVDVREADLVDCPNALLNRIAADDRAAFVGTIERAAEGTSSIMLDHRVMGREGVETWVQSCLTGAAFQENPNMVVGTTIAIETRTATASQRYDTRPVVSTSDSFHVEQLAMIGRVASGIAHDVNNTLTAAKTYCELVRDALPSDSPQADDIDQALLSVQRAAELSRHMLSLSHAQRIEPSRVNVRDTVIGLRRWLELLLGKRIDLIVEMKVNVWIWVDPVRFEQIIVNLAANARDAMPNGGLLRIASDVVQQRDADLVSGGGYARLVVSDTGNGMTPDVKARIFEPYFTTKTRDTGTGLGLATVFEFVEQSQGRIAVESQLGVGTTFALLLPLVDDETGHVESESPESVSRIVRTNSSSPLIDLEFVSKR